MHIDEDHAVDDAFDPPEARAAFRDLLRWYRPYLQGLGGRLTWTLVATAIVLACQAAVPLQVESILHHEVWSTGAVVLLLGLVLVQLVLGHAAHLGAHDVANRSALALRLRVFDRLLHTRTLRPDVLHRSAVVSRHTSDVDNVSEAFELTIAQGIPGIIRVILSLAFLTLIEWRAGIAMTVASLAFIVVRRFVGRNLLVVDRRRLEASSSLGEAVDETITGSRLIAGLHLDRWVSDRFGRQARRLMAASHAQGSKATQMITGAHAAGLAGLVFVTLFAVIAGGENLAGVAAALLYVEGVVKGLEALPSWVRSLQLAVVSRQRIDHVLEPEPDDAAALPTTSGAVGAGFDLATLDVSRVRLVGLVTPGGIEADAVLTAMSSGEGVAHVPDDAVAFDCSVREHLEASGAPLDDARALLDAVGLGHLETLPAGLDLPIGPAGAGLTANERQRLALAIALASRPRTLLVGPLISLADADTALPLLGTLRSGAQDSTIVAVRNPDVAAAMDRMVFVTRDSILTGSHAELLVSSPDYAGIWQQRLHSDEVDLSVLGLGDDALESMYARLVTERYTPGEVIYRQGDVADRILFTISGHVEISTNSESGTPRRVAVLGPGNHCGDLRLTVGEQRAESAHALDDCVVRSLSRDVISAGMTGLLDRTPTERRIVSVILRNGPSSAAQVHDRMPDVDSALFASSLALLVQDGALRDAAGVLSVVQQRSVKSGARDLLDRLGDF